MDVTSTAASMLASEQAIGRQDAQIAMVGTALKTEQQTALALAAVAESAPLPPPAPGKGMSVDVVA